MIARCTPYTQRAIVPSRTVEEAYKIVNVWLRYNDCSVTKENPPTSLEAIYGADHIRYQIGPMDYSDKTINVRMSGFGEDVLLYFTVSQKIDRTGDEGYLYWGVKLQELYTELGVNINDAVLSELLPESRIRKSIDKKTKTLTVFIAISVLIVWYLWEPINNLATMYLFVITLPIVLLAGWDLQEHRKLRKK